MAIDAKRMEWLAERRQGIGGSDVAAILGFSPWATPLSVWRDKTGRSTPQEETLAMKIGTRLEDFVADLYCEETGRKVQRFNRMIHKGCLLGNFDRLVIPEGAKVAAHMGEVRTDTLLECKTGSVAWEDDEVPIYYQTQVQHYMGLCPELKKAHVAYLNKAYNQFSIYSVERDDKVIETMQAQLTEWWEKHIVNDVMPVPINEADCKVLWAFSNPGKKVTATDEVVATVEELRLTKQALNEITEKKDSLETAIKTAIGDSEILVNSTGKTLATWKQGKDKEVVNWKGIADEFNPNEELIKKHTTIKNGSRTFLLKTA